MREAVIWSAAWIGLALAFGAGLYLWRGSGPSLEHLAGYLIENALSVDNLFVFALVFSAFGVPASFSIATASSAVCQSGWMAEEQLDRVRSTSRLRTILSIQDTELQCLHLQTASTKS